MPFPNDMDRKKHLLTCLLLGALLLAGACQEEVFLPKPRGYHRIALPPHEYGSLPDSFPYQFQLSKHAKVVADPHFLAQDYWIEVRYPELNAEIDISYKPIMGRPDSLAGFINTSHKLTRKHSVRASKIDEYATVGGTQRQYRAVVFELDGEVPSYFHWYAHDSTQHFLRAALYFDRAESADSLRPVIEYLKLDMMHMLQTLEFQREGRR